MRFVSRVVTLDGIEDPGALELVCRVNGGGRRHPQVHQMIFDVPETITQLPAGPIQRPGDIIATGTPSGAGYAMDPPRRRRASDVVPGGSAGIGTSRTHIEGLRA